MENLLDSPNYRAFSYLLLFFIFPFPACGQENTQAKIDTQKDQSLSIDERIELINPKGSTIETRINTPEGFIRTSEDAASFAEYLRQLPLKPHNSEVTLFNGGKKPNYHVYDAVVNLEIGKKDLHQCADAIMRLRAEYFWEREEFEKIHFNFTNGFRADYSEWIKGKRIVVKGNSSYWNQSQSPSNSYDDFWKYLEIIFSYAGTLSLSQELKSVKTSEIQIGDIFIQGGSPGHAVIVVDMATNELTGKRIFLLAQSYMPAQEIQLLKNPGNESLSPWYSVDFGESMRTPEWTFHPSDLKRFPEE